MRVIDLFRQWDEDNDGTISKAEFRKAMPLLGLDVPKKEIDRLFDSWDLDRSGSLELTELNRRLRRTDVQIDDALKVGNSAPLYFRSKNKCALRKERGMPAGASYAQLLMIDDDPTEIGVTRQLRDLLSSQVPHTTTCCNSLRDR